MVVTPMLRWMLVTMLIVAVVCVLYFGLSDKAVETLGNMSVPLPSIVR